MTKDIKALLKDRYHGASSINGFYYQIIYSVLLGLELFQNQSSILTLEGIEDIDYNNIDSKCITDSKYMQVKYRKKEVTWTEFSKILKNFIKTYEVDKTRSFKIITNISFASTIENFRKSLKKRNKAKKKILQNDESVLSPQEIDNLFDLIEFEVISTNKIEELVLQKIFQQYKCNEELALIINKVLISNFTKTAIERGDITFLRLSKLCNQVLEATSTEEYNAYGNGLIEKVFWNTAADENFFYKGKTTQPGHIGLDLDIKREKWLKIIQESFYNNNTTILKAASGQGKTTLMFRYARDYGIEETTYIIRSILTETDAVRIIRYLETINKIGLKILVLIDDINRNTKFWSSLISKCQGLNIDFLLTIKEENWSNYVRYSDIQFEVVTPFLDKLEASDIFSLLKNKNLINKELSAYEEAYELLKEPKLLIEFLYLCTQGVMLKDKLQDQISNLNDDRYTSSKKKILRFVSLASVLGIELKVSDIIDFIPTDEDIESIIETLRNEFITITDKIITGFHQVRSQHLVEILHNDYLPILSTAKEIFKLLQTEQIYPFISNLLNKFPILYEDFLKEFKEFFKSFNLLKFNEIINAVYNTGIYNYINHNKNMIDEAYELIGFSALSLISYEIMPKREESGFDSIFNSFQNQGHFPKLKEITLKEKKIESGIEYVKRLLEYVSPVFHNNDYKAIGIFINWCEYVNSEISNWEKISENLIFIVDFSKINFDSLCHFTYGLYKYDKESYFSFIELNRNNLIDYLKYELECFLIDVSNEDISIQFVPILSDNDNKTNQAVPKLEKLYMIFPYLKKYNSNAKNILLGGLNPSVSNNEKSMISKYLIPEIDSKRNSELYRQMIMCKIPATFYNVQKFWFELRTISLKVLTMYGEYIELQYKGLNPKEEKLKNKNFDFLWIEIGKYLSHTPYIGQSKNNQFSLDFSLEKILHSDILNSWATSLDNFYRQYTAFANGKNDSIKLCLHNLKDVIYKFEDFHKFFSEYFSFVPDYFEQLSLKNKELEPYQKIYALLELRFILNEDRIIENPVSYIRNLRATKTKMKINTLNSCLSDIAQVCESILEENHLTYIPIVFECEKPENNFENVIEIIKTLSVIEEEVVSYYWLIPIYKGNRFNEFGYLISFTTIMKLKKDPEDFYWETFMPQEIPENIIDLIPNYRQIIENTNYDNIANSEATKMSEEFIKELGKFVAELPDKLQYEKLLKENYSRKIDEMKKELNTANKQLVRQVKRESERAWQLPTIMGNIERR